MVNEIFNGYGDRLRTLRKSLKMTQTEFADLIKTTSGHVSDMEKGRKNLSERSIKIICDEFNVSEIWLRTGNGEMYIETTASIIFDLSKQYNLDELDQLLILEYAKLMPEYKKAIKEYICNIKTVI